MRGKRGQIETKLIFILIELALIAMFIAAVMYRVNNAVNDQTYYQRFYARDVALLYDSISASEGDFRIIYELSTSKPVDLNFYLNQGIVSVYDARKGEEKNKVSFLYGKSRITTAQESSSIDDKTSELQENNKKYVRLLKIEKEGANLLIGDVKNEDLNPKNGDSN